MSKLLPVRPAELVKVLGKLGFKLIRQKGSHAFLKHQDGRCTTIPLHKGEVIGRGLLCKILSDVELSHEEWLEAINK